MKTDHEAPDEWLLPDSTNEHEAMKEAKINAAHDKLEAAYASGDEVRIIKSRAELEYARGI